MELNKAFTGKLSCMAKVNAVRELLSVSGEELRPLFGRTLMPSVLDRSFKGFTVLPKYFYCSFGFIHFAFTDVVCVGSRNTQLFDPSGSVHTVRLKQHGLRSPAVSFDDAVSIRRLRVSVCLVERIQRIQSQRAPRVISMHRVCACGAAASAFFKSAGTLGSGHSLIGSI